MTLNPRDNPQSVFPQELLAPGSVPNPAAPWWVARTRPRREKALARCLLSKRIAYFRPLVARPQKHQGRMRTSDVPLFDSCLFFQADAEGRQAALRTGHLAQAIAVADQYYWRTLHWPVRGRMPD